MSSLRSLSAEILGVETVDALSAVTALGLSWTLRTAVVLGLAWGITRLVHRTSAASRHMVWVASFVAVSVLPLFSLGLPWRWEVARLPDVTPHVVSARGGAAAADASDRAAAGSAESSGDEGAGVAALRGAGEVRFRGSGPPLGRDSDRSAPGASADEADSRTGAMRRNVGALSALGPVGGVTVLWGLGTMLALGFLARGRAKLARARREGVELTTPVWRKRLARLAAAVGVDEDIEILESPKISVPLTVGVLRKQILLPAGATSRWPSERLDAVLLHELGHVRRRDVWSHLLGRVLCAIHWFNPLVWIASRRMARECERACDDLVLRTGARPSEYAEHLLEIVRSERRESVFTPALAMARKGDFEGRILALLDPDAPRQPIRKKAAATIVAGVAAVALLVSVPVAEGTSPGSDTPTTGDGSEGRGAAVPPATALAPAADTTPPGEVRASIQTALSESEAVEATLAKTLAELLNDPHPRVRTAAARSLGDRKAEGAIPDLVRALEDPEDEVREEAAVALGDIGDPSTVDALARVLLEDPDEEVRESAAWALGETEGVDAVAHLAVALNRTGSDRVRADIVEALGETRQPGAVRVLADLLADEDRRLRRRALEALVEIDSDEAMGIVIEAMRSDDPYLRRAAAEALSRR